MAHTGCHGAHAFGHWPPANRPSTVVRRFGRRPPLPLRHLSDIQTELKAYCQRSVATHLHEVFFRDTAHGFVTWAAATAIVAVLITSTTSSIFAGGLRAATTTASVATGNASANVASHDVDTLFRNASNPTTSPPTSDGRARPNEFSAHGVGAGSFPPADRTYVASLVATRTGLSPADAAARAEQASEKHR